MSAGKGDRYRRVNQKLYDANYDRIFNKGTDAHPDKTAEVVCCCGAPVSPGDELAPLNGHAARCQAGR